ncbi:AHH domain-containing protein [Myxococcus vastator]|uniref:AHH domain-containing protein n=1 Tax=Myxococcus vastator TaxID=2709664 RepID=UPI0013D34D7D|nr:AHH domain-containing protein [Myxococcus vastator]
MAKQAKERHLNDLNIGKYHFTQGGKSCLNAHVSPYQEGKPCSHRWHARVEGASLRKIEPGHEEENLYKWPSDMPKQPPAGTTWDLSGDNFTTSASVPYSFEAHHVVPNEELSIVINSIGKESAKKNEITLLVRKGLMQEEYNLNDRVNMIILPMMRDEAFALALPKHKRTVEQFNHHLYSCYVRKHLKKALAVVKEDVDAHEEEARENDKAAKESKKEAHRSDEQADRQQTLAKAHTEKGWSGRAGTHEQRAKSHRLQAMNKWAEAQYHSDEAREQRVMAMKKVQANPTGQGKQGIENLSKVLKEGIIAAGLWMKQTGLDGSLENFRDFIKQRDTASSGGGMPD